MAKKKVKSDAGTPSIMDQLASYQPPWEEEGTKGGEADPRDVEIKSLKEQMAKFVKDQDDQRKQQIYGQYQSQVASAPAQQKKSTEVDLEGMPDPVTHTKEYTAELMKRINAMHDQKLSMVQAEHQVEAERAQLATNLWDGFKSAHPDWAEHDMLVEAAASRVSQSMQARGVNVVALMKAQPEVFYGEVAGVLEKQYPQLKGGGEEEEEAEEPVGHRTAGVFGGTPGKQGGVAGSVEDTEAANVQWLRDMTVWQHKQGIK